MKKFVILFLVLNIAFTAFAQQPRNIHNLEVDGTVFSALLIDGSGYNYMVRTTRSGTLVVETTGNTDTYMIAYDSSYRQIATDDDSGQGTNARIQLTVNANETYYFNVTGFGAYTSGIFSVSASMRGGQGTAGGMPGGSTTGGAYQLQLEEVYEGYIQPGETLYFRVYLGTDPWYQITWDDRDRQHFGNLSNPADVRVGLRREDSSSYVIPISDSGNYNGNFSSYSNEHRVHEQNSGSSPRFDFNTWYIIEVEATYGGGNFRLELF